MVVACFKWFEEMQSTSGQN